MSRVLSGLGLLAVVVMASGCAMCCGPYDDLYPGFGGKWQRQDPVAGRVGSRFHDASGMVGGGTVIDGQYMEEPMLMEGPAFNGPAYDGPVYDDAVNGGAMYDGPMMQQVPTSVEYIEVGQVPQEMIFTGPQNHLH